MPDTSLVAGAWPGAGHRLSAAPAAVPGPEQITIPDRFTGHGPSGNGHDLA